MPVPVDLSQLNDVAKNDVVKRTVYDKLIAKVDSIDTSLFVLKSKHDTDKPKVPDTSHLIKKTDYNIKTNKLENKIPDVSGLASKIALAAIENKIHSVSSLVQKTDYDTKITEIEKKLTNHIHGKNITLSEFNTMAASLFNARLAQANLVTKTDFDNKVSNLESKIAANKTKNESIENELKN